jgi:hypothetical protein
MTVELEFLALQPYSNNEMIFYNRRISNDREIGYGFVYRTYVSYHNELIVNFVAGSRRAYGFKARYKVACGNVFSIDPHRYFTLVGAISWTQHNIKSSSNFNRDPS